MVNSLILNDSFKEFIEKLDIDQEQKNVLLEKIPKLNKAERVKLLDVLAQVYLLTAEKKETLEKLKVSWQN